MISFLRSTPPKTIPVTTDIHSHLLAGLDDGVKTLDEAVATIRALQEAGYQKAITTPHIIHDYYRNTPELIRRGLDELRSYLAAKGMSFQIEAAAEYYLDEEMSSRVERQEEMLTFGDRYLLFEVNMINEPFQLKEFIFKLKTMALKPVLAHPERYAFMDLKKAEDLHDRGVLFQINILSIIGYYSKPIQKMAQQLIDNGWVDFLGSDTHHEEQARCLPSAQKNKYYQKALALPLLNSTL